MLQKFLLIDRSYSEQPFYELMQFWYKARHNVLPCYYTLSLWYPNQSATCTLDGYSTESTSHVSNGCKKLKHNYTTRHDRIVEGIGEEIKSNEKTIIINKTVRRALRELGVEVENENEEVLYLEPVIIVKERTRMTIWDTACPYDVYISETYNPSLKSIRACKHS